MIKKTVTLTKDDVAKLMADPSTSVRGEMAGKIASHYGESADQMSDAERKIAEDIFRAFARDVEVMVRETMAKHLKSSPELPRDVALNLARDVDSVALPMLKFSEVLTDDDLLEIVRGESATKQVAIAQRDTVSGTVADALIDTGNETAVARLVANEGAELEESHFDRVITEYKTSDAVSDSLARRPSLPPRVSEQLVKALTDQLQDYLVHKQELSPDVATNLVLQARERATVSLLGQNGNDLEQLVYQLHVNGRLTASLILRALCMGDLPFFETAFARLAKLPIESARLLIHDQGQLGLKSIYQRCDMPEKLFPAFRAAINLLSETDYDGEAQDRERFVQKLIERLLTQFEEPGSELTQEDIEYLMGKLNNMAA